MQPYLRRRAQALDRFQGGVAIIPSGRTIYRNGDSTFPFRQDSDFYYLTGFNEPNALLVLAPAHPEHRAILFLRDRDRVAETWNGERLGVERAQDSLSVDAAFSMDDVALRLPDYLAGASHMHYAMGADPNMDRIVTGALETARERARRKGRSPQTIVEPSLVLGEMRLFKDDDEVSTLRRAAEITRIGFETAMRATRPGGYEFEIQALIESEYRRAGAQSTAYESIVASGANATVLHYVSNRHRLDDGGLLLVDSGCELDAYASDVTRTWPINGRFSAEQRALYEIVLAAANAAIAQVRRGIARDAFHQAAIRTIVEGLLDVGLLSGTAQENIERETYRDFYMHGTGHWLGLDVHDAGAYRDADDKPVEFAAGMVTTVEPGIYVRRDLDCDQRFKGIGIRIEDDVLVTRDGNDNLTAAIPKAIESLEAIVGSDAAMATATYART